MTGKVEKYLLDKLQKEKLHFSLIDPDSFSIEDAKSAASISEEAGSDAILIGGSTHTLGNYLDILIESIKASTKLPVIIFPGGVAQVSPKADAILFMSYMNSRNPYFITKSQALGSFLVKKTGIEPIPTGYLVVEPGETVGWMGEADLIPRKKPQIAAAYSLAAQYLGMRLVYLEAGSGAPDTVTPEMVGLVKKVIDIPLIVGGGIRSPESAKKLAMAGADIFVTGTIIEKDKEKLFDIIKAIKN